MAYTRMVGCKYIHFYHFIFIKSFYVLSNNKNHCVTFYLPVCIVDGISAFGVLFMIKLKKKFIIMLSIFYDMYSIVCKESSPVRSQRFLSHKSSKLKFSSGKIREKINRKHLLNAHSGAL